MRWKDSSEGTGATGQPGHWAGNALDQTKRRIRRRRNGDRRIEPAMRREGLWEGLGLKGNSVQWVGIVYRSGISNGQGVVHKRQPAHWIGSAPGRFKRWLRAAPSGTQRTDRAVRREGISEWHVCDGVGSRRSSQAGSEGRREKDEKLTLHLTPNSFMSTSLVKPL